MTYLVALESGDWHRSFAGQEPRDNRSENPLLAYDKARQSLAEARGTDEVRDICDNATAIRAYVQQAKNRQLEIDAAEIRNRGVRRLRQRRRGGKANRIKEIYWSEGRSEVDSLMRLDLDNLPHDTVLLHRLARDMAAQIP